MKKKHRFLKLISLGLAMLSAIVLLCFIGLYIFAKFNINYEADELLFEKASKWKSTTFYAINAHADGAGDVEYSPV